MNELANGKTMTVKEVAEQLHCNSETIKGHIRELFPNLMENGKTTYLNETQITIVLEKMKRESGIGAGVNLQNEIVGIETNQSRFLRLKLLQEEQNHIYEAIIADQQHEIDRLKTIADEHGDHWSVCEYHQRNNLKYDNKAAIAMGKTLAAISRRKGLPIYKVKAYDTTGRFGDVNAYTREAWELYKAACILA
jgi:transposase